MSLNSQTGSKFLNFSLKEWKPSTKLTDLLNALINLIKNPNPDDALESEIGELYKTDIGAYNKKVKEWVKKYALK